MDDSMRRKDQSWVQRARPQDLIPKLSKEGKSQFSSLLCRRASLAACQSSSWPDFVHVREEKSRVITGNHCSLNCIRHSFGGLLRRLQFLWRYASGRHQREGHLLSRDESKRLQQEPYSSPLIPVSGEPMTSSLCCRFECQLLLWEYGTTVSSAKFERLTGSARGNISIVIQRTHS